MTRWMRTHVSLPVVRRIAPQRAHRLVVPEINLPVRLREAFEQLGPTFVKLGQQLSVRPDLVPAAYIAEFERLQSAVPPFSEEDARGILTAELGQSPDTVFQTFEATPLAAASMAQVHAATLPTGERVAVKIQRPGIHRLIEQDLRLIYWLAKLATRWMPRLRAYRFKELIDEFADWTRRELDFRNEALNADHFRYNFRDDPTIYVPAMYWHLTTARVLVMEFVYGATVDQPEQLTRWEIDTDELARRGAHALLKQVFLDGFFHGDPHPGNFFILPGHRICYHDFGIVGYLPDDLRREVTAFFIAFLRGNPEGAVAHMRHLALPLPDADVARFHRELLDLVGAWLYTGHQSLARTFLRMMQSGAAAAVAFPPALALLAKALITVEAVGLRLSPDFDMQREFHPFIAELFQQWLAPQRLRELVESNILDYTQAFSETPIRLTEALTTFSQGDVRIKIDPSEWETLRQELRHTGLMWTLALIVFMLVLAGAVFLRVEGVIRVGGAAFGLVLWGLAGVFALWLLVHLFRR